MWSGVKEERARKETEWEEVRDREIDWNMKYPHIPAEVIREIVIAQYDYQDKRLEARNATNKIVNDFLNEAAKQEG